MNRSQNRSMSGTPRVHFSVIAIVLLVAGWARGAVMLTQDSVAAVLHRYAVENGPWRAENIEIRVLPFQTVSLPAAAPKLRILRPVNGITPGLHSFLIAADVAGKEPARFWVKAEVRVFEVVVVTSQPLAFRDIVKGTDMRLERRDISSLHARPFYRIEEVVGQQAMRPIPANETLTQRNLDRPPVMRRGSPVVLLYETGSLRVETPGIAEENGRAGEMIQVKNSASNKLLRGLVLDGRIVRVN